MTEKYQVILHDMCFSINLNFINTGLMFKLNTTQMSTFIYSVTKHTLLKCAGLNLHEEFYI